MYLLCILRIGIYNKFYPVYILEAKSQSLRPDISAYGGQAVSGNERTTSAPNFSQRGGGGRREEGGVFIPRLPSAPVPSPVLKKNSIEMCQNVALEENRQTFV